MAKWGVVFLVAITLLASHVSARNTPRGNNVGLSDEKNVVNFGGVGGYSGIGNNGLPIGGVFGGVGSGADIGGVGGFGGIGGGIGTGSGGLGGLSGGVGTLPGSGFGTLPGSGVVTLPGTGVGSGVLPFP